jgi:hypothetical protein
MLEKAMARAARIGCNCRRKIGTASKGWSTPAATGTRTRL